MKDFPVNPKRTIRPLSSFQFVAVSLVLAVSDTSLRFLCIIYEDTIFSIEIKWCFPILCFVLTDVRTRGVTEPIRQSSTSLPHRPVLYAVPAVWSGEAGNRFQSLDRHRCWICQWIFHCSLLGNTWCLRTEVANVY